MTRDVGRGSSGSARSAWPFTLAGLCVTVVSFVGLVNSAESGWAATVAWTVAALVGVALLYSGIGLRRDARRDGKGSMQDEDVR